MRNYLISDRLPPSEEVRVEEFVDFFPSGYEVNEDDFLLSLDVAPSPFASEGKVLMRLVFQTPSLPTDVSMPERLVLMTDISNSMDDLASDEFSSYGLESLKRYELVNLAVEHFLSSLPDGTVVNYHFGTPNGYMLDPVPLGVANSNGMTRERFLELFQRDSQPLDHDDTRIGLYYKLMEGVQVARAEETSTLFLVFSGDVPSLGDLVYRYGSPLKDSKLVADSESLAKDVLAQVRQDEWSSLAIIGVSVRPSSADVLKTAAELAGGTSHHINQSEQAKRLFADYPPRLLSIAAQDVSIEVDFDPTAVASYRLLGFDGHTGEVCKKMAESSFIAERVNLGGDYTILYELDLANRSGSASVLESLADVRLNYRRPGEGEGNVTENVSRAQISERFEEASPHFRLAVVAAEFAEALGSSPYPEAEDLAGLMAEADTLAEEFPINWDSKLNPSDFIIPELADLLRSAAFLMYTKPPS